MCSFILYKIYGEILKTLYCTFVAPVNCMHQNKIKVQNLWFSLLINLDRIFPDVFLNIPLTWKSYWTIIYHLCCWVWNAKVLFFPLLNYFLKLKHCKGFHGFILKCQHPFLRYKSNQLKYEGIFKVFSDQSSAHLIKCIRIKDPFLGTLMCLAWTNSDLKLVNCKLGKLFL